MSRIIVSYASFHWYQPLSNDTSLGVDILIPGKNIGDAPCAQEPSSITDRKGVITLG